METTIRALEIGDKFQYNGEQYIINQKGIQDAHCINLNAPEHSLTNLDLVLHNSTLVDTKFKIGDYVRLGNDIPYQVLTENGLKNVNSYKNYRFATNEEIILAKLHRSYKINEGVVTDDRFHINIW